LRRITCTTVAEKNVPAMETFLQGRSYDLAYCFGLHRISLATAYPLTSRGIPILWHAGGTYVVDQLYRWPAEIAGFRIAMNTVAKKWHDMERRTDYSHIAYISEFLRDEFHRYGMRVPNEYIIPRGIGIELGADLDRRRADPPTFLVASRMDREKGIDVAVAAFVELHRRSPSLHWKLQIAGAAGDPSYKAELEEAVRAGGIADRVEFLGKIPLDRVLSHMRDATAFISPSRFGEPFGRTNIEAMASGTPLIASITGAIKEIAVHGESALMYDKEDALALSRHLENVLTDSTLRTKLASNALNVIRSRFTLDSILDQTEIVMKAMVSEARHQKAGAA